MNTIRSTWYGWAGLCVAGGGAYYFAKRSINADRAARYEAEQSKQARLRKLEPYSPPSDSPHPTRSKKPKTNVAGGTATDLGSSIHNGKGVDHAGSPSTEASVDAAPVEHAPTDEAHEIRERSKYEAAQPYRSKKGDRFS